MNDNFDTKTFNFFETGCSITIRWDGTNLAIYGRTPHSNGQCPEDILKRNPKNNLVKQIVKLWRKYHLNDMNAGTPAQSKELARRQKLENLDQMPDYDGQCRWLKEAGLYEVQLPRNTVASGGLPADVVSGRRGYQYGERWLFRPIPAKVKKEIEALFNS